MCNISQTSVQMWKDWMQTVLNEITYVEASLDNFIRNYVLYYGIIFLNFNTKYDIACLLT